jgi:hypothetical protein
MRFCNQCGVQVRLDARFCSTCGHHLAPYVEPLPALPGPPAAAPITAQLRALGVSKRVFFEICQTPCANEVILGVAARSFKEKLIFTNSRVISVSPVPDYMRRFERDLYGRMSRMGGNFQYLCHRLFALKQTATRVPEGQGGIIGHPALTRVVKAAAPIAVRKIWPFEFEVLDLEYRVIDRIYRVSTKEAAQIAQLAAGANLRIIVG